MYNDSTNNTCELRSLQNLQEDQVILSSVLDVVAVRLWEIAHIASHIIEGSCRVGGTEERRPTLSLDEEGPFITGRVPVDLTHTTGVNSDDRCGEIAGDGEIDWVNDLDGSTGNLMSWLLGEMVRVTLGTRNDTRRCRHVLLFNVLWCWRALENV